MKNGTMLQGFEWELPADGNHWRLLRRRAFALRRLGFTAVWLPPAYKGCGGKNDVGYGVYDLYDLGEFPQKGATRTKYGTRGEYQATIRAFHAVDVQVLADVVFNHRMGADESEEAEVVCDDPEHRLAENRPRRKARLYTRFTFPGRHGKYSDFLWDKSCFTGTDWDEAAREHGLFRLADKTWAADVDAEKENYDYLMGCDVDVRQPTVVRELLQWGNWYLRMTHVDGFRLDAVKHISAAFYRDWLKTLRDQTGRELFAVGEYWHCDVHILHRYLDAVEERMSLFDVPLHCRFRDISTANGQFDMAHLFDGTLVGSRPHLAVTFVDNHDTQPGQSLESWVGGWFKASAYGLILLRSFGYPCVFWGDLYGIPTRKIGRVAELPTLLWLRRRYAHGPEHDYFDHFSVIGFTREGEREEPGSGLAFLCTDGAEGFKTMQVGQRYAGRVFRCVLGGQPDVEIGADGCGTFTVRAGGCSAYVPRLTLGEYLRRAAHLTRLSVMEMWQQLKAWVKEMIHSAEIHRG